MLFPPGGAFAGKSVQIQGIANTSTQDVFIGSLVISIQSDYEFKLKPIGNVISHYVNPEISFDYRGYAVYNVSVLGYDDMEFGVITLSEDNGIVDYEYVKLSARSNGLFGASGLSAMP
jgi:hypothetical protein